MLWRRLFRPKDPEDNVAAMKLMIEETRAQTTFRRALRHIVKEESARPRPPAREHEYGLRVVALLRELFDAVEAAPADAARAVDIRSRWATTSPTAPRGDL